jgi:hypothetical protein
MVTETTRKIIVMNTDKEKVIPKNDKEKTCERVWEIILRNVHCVKGRKVYLTNDQQ